MQMLRIYPSTLILYVRWGKEYVGHKSIRCLQDLYPYSNAIAETVRV